MERAPMNQPKSPRILLSGVVLGEPMGGVRRHNAELLPRASGLLSKNGGNLTVIEGSTPISFPLGKDVERIRTRVPFQPPWQRWALEQGTIERAVKQAAAEGRPFDLWHTAHLPVPRVPLPYALTIHDLRDLTLDSTSALRKVISPRLFASAIQGARVVMTVSDYMRDEIRRRFRPRRVVVIPNAADHMEFAERKPSEDPFLLHVGHIERRKNLELMLHALALDPELPRLVLAGTPKSGEDLRLKRIADQLGVSERVQILENVTDETLIELYSQATCVVIPSFMEGFGIGVLEAQLARAPLAVSNAGALPEVAGQRVPSFSPDVPEAALTAIKKAINQSSEEARQACAQAQRYSWQKSAEALTQAWIEAVGGR